MTERHPDEPIDPDFGLVAPGGEHPGDPIDPDVGPPAAAGSPRVGRIAAAVALGGAIGAPIRYEIAVALPTPAGGFPVSTFLINVTGSLVLGLLLTLIVERWPPSTYLRAFAATGVLGAYTTWSTFMVDTDVLLRGGSVAMAVLYVLATLVAGLGAAAVGILAGRRFAHPGPEPPTSGGAGRLAGAPRCGHDGPGNLDPGSAGPGSDVSC